MLVDIAPLRHRQFRLLFGGQLVSFVGSQLTMVAVPVQVFELTGSSLAVGLVSLAQVVPLVLGSLVGGAVADRFDRRRLLLLMQVALAATGAGLALNARLGQDAALWPVVALSATAAGLSGVDRPARSALIPSLVAVDLLPAAYSLWQIHLQVGSVVGPALAGGLLARLGLAAVYWIDVATFAVAFLAVSRMHPAPPAGGGTPVGLGSIVEGLRFVRQRPVLAGVFLVDVNAMVLGMPRALFPELAERLYQGGPGVVGLLFAAPGAGALLGALFTGWVGSVRRQGMAVLVAVAAWGAAIAGFGLVRWLPLGLALLGLAGAADVVSAVFRNTILQTSTPDHLRGRLSSIQIAVVTGGPRVGDFEAGAVAAVAGARFSVVSGGVGCVVGAALLGWLLPQFCRYQRPAPAALESNENT